jgi:hypothetical protein
VNELVMLSDKDSKQVDMPEQPARLGLPKQFLITHEDINPPAGWSSLTVGDRNLYVSPELPVTRLVTTSNEVNPRSSFLVLGWFVVDGTMYPNEREPTLRTDLPVERLYFDMTGRFLVICHSDAGLQCITDPGGLLSLVFRPDTGEAASTPASLSLTRPVYRCAAKEDGYRRRDPTAWFPFGVTPFEGIQRALPGCMVEPASGAVTPVPEPVLQTFNQRESVEYIHTLSRDFVNAVGSGRTIESHLTAGWDSRMVLSACLMSAADTEYVTYKAPGTNGDVDSFVAKRIAQTFSLRHREVPLLPTRDKDIEDWIDRTSGCIRDSVMNLSTTVASSDTGRYVLCGVAGEVGRAFYWQRDDIGKTGLSAKELLRRLGFLESRQAVEAADQWLGRLPGCTRTTILDQAYIDLRLGGWAGPSVYGHPVSRPTLSPFNNAKVFSLMRQLPEKYRQSGQFAEDFVALGSTSLARIPVNRAAGLNRIRFVKRELAALIPKKARTSLRALVAD